MSPISPDLPQTSTNLGIMRTGNEQFVATSLVRSSLTSEKTSVVNDIRLLTEHLGGQVLLKDEYPAWEYNEVSDLRNTMQQIYTDMFGKEAKVMITHGGLECGLFYGKIDGLDAVSIGPDIKDIHSPSEKLSISSAQRTWEYLLKVLEALK
jgi:dipeptidase D